MRESKSVVTLIVGALALALFGCGSDDGGDSLGARAVDVAGVWPVDDPVEHGFDPVLLEDAAAWVEGEGSDSLLVVHEGAIVFERYWNGGGPETMRQLFSVTKSFASTLVGVAEQRDLLSVDDLASSYISEWVGTDSEELLVRHLMTGDSGRYWDFASDFPGFGGEPQPDITQYAIGRGQQFPAETTWQYNQMAIQCLDRVLSEAAGVPTTDFAERALFDPLGMRHTIAGTDQVGQMTMSWGMASSARDMARLGYLYLKRGSWNGEQLVSEDFIAAATTQANPINTNYGYLFWLNPDGGWYEAVTLVFHPEGKPYPDAPSDVFVASGALGQMVFVSPSEDLIIIRQGQSSPTGSAASALFYNEIYRRVIAARM